MTLRHRRTRSWTGTWPTCGRAAKKSSLSTAKSTTSPRTLPTYSSTKKYRGKVVTFQKPLFPGYVFLQLNRKTREVAIQSNYVANMLEVHDQEEFKKQLSDILFALDQNVDIRVEPMIGKGNRVMIKSGSLQGQEGWVEDRFGMTTVLLRLDFIGQAAAIKVDASILELI